ncbi:hypothetical protein C8J57DRAFT_1713435, partial [Mycena rebaudengoi]
ARRACVRSPPPVPASGVCSPQPQRRSPVHPFLGCARLAPSFAHRRAAAPCGCVCVLCGFAPSTSGVRVVTPCGCAGVPRASFFAACQYRGCGTGDSRAHRCAPFSSRLGRQHPSRVAPAFVH